VKVKNPAPMIEQRCLFDQTTVRSSRATRRHW
jgi:hypothetical protein